MFFALLQIFTQASRHEMAGCLFSFPASHFFSNIRLNSVIIYHREYLMLVVLRSADMKPVLKISIRWLLAASFQMDKKQSVVDDAVADISQR